MARVLNVLALLVLGGLVGIVGWWTHHYRGSVIEQQRDLVERDSRIAGLTEEIEEQGAKLHLARVEVDRVSERNRQLARQKRELELRNRLLRLDHRLATIEVVDVFPCAPAMATLYFNRISSASISARGMTGIDAFSAATTSGLSAETAEEVTTTSAPAIWSSIWPLNILPPNPFKRRIMSVDFKSDPDTV